MPKQITPVKAFAFLQQIHADLRKGNFVAVVICPAVSLGNTAGAVAAPMWFALNSTELAYN